MGNGIGQQLIIPGHILPLFGFPVEPVAKLQDGVNPPDARSLEHLEDLLGVGAAVADLPVVLNIDKVPGMHRAGHPLAGVPGGGVALPQKEYGPGRRPARPAIHHGIHSVRQRFQFILVLLQVAQQLGKEVVQRQVAQRRRIVQVLHSEDFLLEPPQLFVAEAQFRLRAFLRKGVIAAAGGDVGQSHPRQHPAFQVQVLVHILRRPIVHHPHPLAAAANAVNAPETLDEPHRVPVNIVVQHRIAVLKVLPLGNAVGGNQQVNVGGRGTVRPVAGRRRKVGQDFVKGIAAGRGVVGVPRHHRDVDAQFAGQFLQLAVQILGGILKGSEHQQFAVGLPIPVDRGLLHPLPEYFPDFLQLAIPFRRNCLHLLLNGGQGSPVLLQVRPPAYQIQLPQMVGLTAPVDRKLFILLVLFRQNFPFRQGSLRPRAALFVAVNLVQQVSNLADSPLQGQVQRIGRTFQPFQEVGTHHPHQIPLPVFLAEVGYRPLLFQRRLAGRVNNILGGLIDRQAELFNLFRQFPVREFPPQIRWRVFVARRDMLRKAADTVHFLLVHLLNLPPGAGNGHPVQQPQEIGAQTFQQLGFVPPTIPPLARRPGFPILELLLRRLHHAADVAHLQTLLKGVIPPLGHQINLIPQIHQGGVDRRSRKQQHLGFGAGGDDLIQ